MHSKENRPKIIAQAVYIRVVFINIENLLFYRRISKSCISQFNPVVSVVSVYYIIFCWKYIVLCVNMSVLH